MQNRVFFKISCYLGFSFVQFLELPGLVLSYLSYLVAMAMGFFFQVRRDSKKIESLSINNKYTQEMSEGNFPANLK